VISKLSAHFTLYYSPQQLLKVINHSQSTFHI